MSTHKLLRNSQAKNKMIYRTNNEDYDKEHPGDEVFLMYGIQSTNTKTEDDCSISIASEGSEALNERLDSQLFIVRALASGKILAQFPIEESDSIAEHLVERNIKSRVSCMSFRSMLQPILKEKVPVRDEVWLRRCMRGILVFAIGSADSQEDSLGLSLSKVAKPSIGPAHVYCWFMENHGITPDDEDIWSFYYGIRRLAAKRDAEACLHYQMLDDVNLDYAEFFVEALLLIRSRMDQSWHAQFNNMETECQQHIWIPTDVTKQVISHMFSFWPDPTLSIEDLNRKAEEFATQLDSEEEKEMGHLSSRVGLFVFLDLVMKGHIDQIKKQTTLLRVMFETASNSKAKDQDVSVHTEKLVSATQLHKILKAVHESITLTETTLLYRDAYALLVTKAMNGYAPRGITFDSFLFAAKQRGLFARIRQAKKMVRVRKT